MSDPHKESDNTVEKKAPFFSVSTKVTLFVVFTAFVTAAVLGGFLYFRMIDEILAVKKDELQIEAQYASNILKTTLNKIERDLLVLKKTPPIEGIIRSSKNNGIDPLDGSSIEQWKARLASIFESVSEQERSYIQIRFIGVEDDGREIVRVNKGLKDDDAPIIVPENGLQSKAGEPYFQEALTLESDDVYYSPINLNREHGRVQEPHMIVIRVLVPVFDGNRLFGILVINSSYDVFFGEFFEHLQQGHSVFVMTGGNVAHFNKIRGEQKFLHYHHDDTHKYARIFDDFKTSLSQRGSYFASHEGREAFFTFVKQEYGGSNHHDFIVALSVSKEMMFESLNEIRFQAAMATAVAIILLTFFSLYISTIFTRPLKKMISEIRRYEGSPSDISLPVTLKDEIGELARAYKDQLVRLQRSEFAEKHSLARLEAIVESTVDGIITIDDRGKIETYNNACIKIFGYSREEAVGHNVKILMPEPYHSDHDQYLKNYHKTGVRQIIGIGREVAGKRKNGEIFPLELAVSEIQVQGRRLYSGIVRDISLRKKSEENILRSNEELERFAYIASHDLQEPLRMVTNFVHLLDEEYKDKLDEQGEQYLEYITDAAGRMRELIEGILSYSRLNQGETKHVKIDCNLQAQVVLKNLRDAIEQKQAEVIVEDLPEIRGNPLNFSRLLQNLIGNSLKYSQDDVPPVIRVTAEDKGDEWQFSVQDNGIGIKDEYCDQVFVIFKRLHGKHEYRGTGIGLAVCKRIVESMDGKIWIESEFGKGSAFFFTVPKISG